ncbi:MAG: biopolymer transporter ExbD [Steroidobacteraceae bacterium]|nr:biopolymer transporter ExbD [Steroidobacteraceae bacterium]MDW8260498.1 biopolymer transporter ExbD [Gammaproteobacteria bacterium]
MSASSRAKRMERHHKRNRPASLNMVSLMDIFTILVFFLLVNQAEVQALDVPKEITLPQSMATQRPAETVVVMVTPEQILVQGRPVARIAEVDRAESALIAPLRDALKQQSDRLLRAAARADIAGREITILGDKTVPYRIMKKVMLTCTDADYGKVSLAVLQRDEALAVSGTGTG